MIEQTQAPDTKKYWDALKEVMDPEFPISVVDLGLIRDIQKAGDTLHVKMTFTSTGCACMHFIEDDIRDRLLEEADVEKAEISVVWDPPWTVDEISEEGRRKLKYWGVRA